MRTLILIALAAVLATAQAVDLKPGQDLPFVRLVVKMPDGTTRTDDGWWDMDLRMLFHEKADAFVGTYPDERIAQVIPATNPQAVKPMPAYVRDVIRERLEAQAAAQAGR